MASATRGKEIVLTEDSFLFSNTVSNSDQVDSTTSSQYHHQPVPPVPAEPITTEPVACQQTLLQDDVTNNAGDSIHQHNDVTNNAEQYEEPKTFVSTTTFTLSSS